MNLLTKASAETHEILNNARADRDAGVITDEMLNEIVFSCFRAEAERQILAGKYPETMEAVK